MLDEADQAPEGWTVSLQRERPARYSTHCHFLWVIFCSCLMTSLIGIIFCFSGFLYSSSGFEKYTECSTFFLHYKPNLISFAYWLMDPLRNTSCWPRIVTLCPFHDQFHSGLQYLRSSTCVFQTSDSYKQESSAFQVWLFWNWQWNLKCFEEKIKILKPWQPPKFQADTQLCSFEKRNLLTMHEGT